MKTKGSEMLASAMKSRNKPVKKAYRAGAASLIPGNTNPTVKAVSSVGKAYSNATKGLKNVGAGIRKGVTGAFSTRMAEQKNYDDQIASGDRSNYYAPSGTFKRKKSRVAAKK